MFAGLLTKLSLKLFTEIKKSKLYVSLGLKGGFVFFGMAGKYWYLLVFYSFFQLKLELGF